MNSFAIAFADRHFSWVGFFKYSKWGLEFLYFRPPLSLVTLTLLGNLATSLALRWPFRRDRWKKMHNLICLNFLFFPAIVAIGVVGAVDPNPTLPPRPNVLPSGSRTAFSSF